MTEKRFTRDNTGCVLDNTRIVKAINVEQVVDCLNALYEENKQLRLLVDTLKEQNMKFKLRLKDLGVEYL